MTVVEARRQPLEALAEAAARVAASTDLRGALDAIASSALEATDADLVVLRVLDQSGELRAAAVVPEASALAGEVAGSRATPADIEAGTLTPPTGRAAERVRAAGLHVAPARVGGRLVGALELVRVAAPFDERGALIGDVVATALALAVKTFGAGEGELPVHHRTRWLELAGEALAAGGDSGRAAQQALRVAADATGALAGAVWRLAADRDPELVASLGDLTGVGGRAAELAAAAAGTWRPAAVEREPALPDSLPYVATLPLGEPAFAALQLFYGAGGKPPADELPALAAFAGRAAHAFRSAEKSTELVHELDRTRSLLEVVGEAISHLSLAHTLETAVERLGELLQIDQLGVYLVEAGALVPAAGRGLVDGHEQVAGRLLELALGPLRARQTILVEDGGTDPILAPARDALRPMGRRAALAVPLQASDEPTGLLVAYPGRRAPVDGDVALLAALAAQLAVAVQNARLHEESKELGRTLAGVLASERQAARSLTALYEISRSFAQSLSLATTLDTVTSTIVDVLGVDAAVIRVPDERGDQFVPRAVHVVDSRLVDPIRTILERPQPRPPRTSRPLLLDAVTAGRLGGAHALLVPFLEKGSTAALLPIATPTELLAQLTILSLDPASPIGSDTLATAGTISQQAALAIDNARLYQQQKQFAETMQQSLLPQERPAIEGLEVGTVYESAAQVDVGGDVFDFVELQDGRLAVVLGDVTGHGIDATADMAMAKFVFRSLARNHPDPGVFLSRANDVMLDELAGGKFITMVSVVIDPRGEVTCASAGHPEPRLVLADGRVEPLRCNGIALGVEPTQDYESVRAGLPRGAAVVLYTDGVIEARRGRELFGVEQLDLLLSERHREPPQRLADAILETCRSYAGGELADDCAVVVIRRL